MNATLYDPSDVAFGAQPRLMARLAEKLETSPQAWADFGKWCRGGGV